MKKKLFFAVAGLFSSSLFLAQNMTVFNDVPFYSMYHYLGAGETMPAEAYSQIPAGAIRLHAYEQDIISRKLTDAEIATIGSSVTMNITLKAACDNYDRIAGVNLVLVPKGSASYTFNQANIKRIELGRFITPFMNKNATIKEVPYSFKVDHISNIPHDFSLSSLYDFWIEFRADGYSAAANTQVAGCADRTDVFRGNLEFVTSGTATPAQNFFLPISYRDNLNNYNATDVVGQTTRIVTFILDQPVENVILHLTSSNHGSNSAGEEYVRRVHYVYLDNQLVHEYEPGGKNCEAYRPYNTQSNGIYGTAPKTLRAWISWNNWCPGDAIPNREVSLGNLSAGTHTIKLDVPDARFAAGQGYFPISMYLQNSTSGQIICAEPSNFKITNQFGPTVNIGWKENGNSSQWETIWSRKSVYTPLYEDIHQIQNTPVDSRNDLTTNWLYEMYVKSKCTSELNSIWRGPIFSTVIRLGTDETSRKKVSVYPNPTKDFVNITASSEVNKLTIFGTDGKQLLDTASSKIDLTQLPTGVYMMKIDFADGTSSFQKMMKQ
ncbi:peptide-N-glycosidase F-related protein [Epilithonimonas tenax]|uniref:peptide-N-glycosidase F-related protein n=1 Tax=Epilithonimonas tenax TaxID=191577 RepID=UPI0004183E66|nr:peptide-N-glycosidase F-related protein [Epilithonimonas tenax]